MPSPVAPPAQPDGKKLQARLHHDLQNVVMGYAVVGGGDGLHIQPEYGFPVFRQATAGAHDTQHVLFTGVDAKQRWRDDKWRFASLHTAVHPALHQPDAGFIGISDGCGGLFFVAVINDPRSSDYNPGLACTVNKASTNASKISAYLIILLSPDENTHPCETIPVMRQYIRQDGGLIESALAPRYL